MAYNEFLADRIRERLNSRKIVFEEKKMMGGLTFMIDDKMCVGIMKDDLMARINPIDHQDAIAELGARTMDFTKKPMIGYVLISPEGVDRETDLDKWIERCLAFNPLAKSSKKMK